MYWAPPMTSEWQGSCTVREPNLNEDSGLAPSPMLVDSMD